MENYDKQNFFGLPRKVAYFFVISTWIIGIYAIVEQQKIIRQYQSIVDETIHNNQTQIKPSRTLLKPEPPFDCMTISEYNYIFNPSINDRYAISAQNILRSCVVRYFLSKFIAGCPSVSGWMFKKKGKKCVGAALVIPEIMCTFVCFQQCRPCRLLGGC